MTTIGFKRIGLAFAVLVIVGLGAIAVTSFLISTEVARDAVKAQIRAATGLDPTIRGEVRVSIFPPDTVSFRDVVLGDDRGAPALVAESLTAHLRLLPLLGGHIEIADISLERPRIAIKFDPSGRSNWAPLLHALAGAVKPDADRSLLSFSEIHIKDGTIIVSSGDTEETVNQVDLSLAWPSIAKTFAATGQFVWRDQPLEASLAVGDFYAALIGNQAGMKVRISAAPIKVAFDGVMSNRPIAEDRRDAGGGCGLAARCAAMDGHETAAWRRVRPLHAEGPDQCRGRVGRDVGRRYRARRQCGGRCADVQ